MNNKLNHATFAGTLLFVWGFLAAGLLVAAEPKLSMYGKSRTWTIVGKPQVAKMISAGDEWVTLENEDGTSKRHLLGFASQADQAFVRSFLELRLKQVPAKFRKSRKWTDRSGKVLGEGPISSASDKDLFIQTDGKPKGLFFPFLSDEDKQFISEFLEASPSNPAEYGTQPEESDNDLGPRDFRPMKQPLKEKFGQARTWTDITGQFQTRASLHSASEIEVRLVLENGRGLTLKRGKLAEADREFLDAFLTEWVETPDDLPEEVDPAMPNNPFDQLPTSIRLADGFVPERELHEYGQKRVWKDQSGIHFVEAELLAANQQTVQLKLENLRYINISVDQLDAADRKLVGEFVFQAEKQTETLAAKAAVMKQPTTHAGGPPTGSNIKVKEISLIERPADFTHAKRLNYSAEQPWNVPQLSPIAQQQPSPKEITIGLEKCDNARMATQSPVALACQVRWPRISRLVMGMPEPAEQIAYELGDGSWRLKHISPDGTSAVLIFDKKSDCRVGIVDIQGTEIVPRFQFVADKGEGQSIERAFLLSRDRLVTVLFKNVITLWDLSPPAGPVALARYEPSDVEFNSQYFTVAPGGEVFAFVSSKGILLIDRDKGKVVGTIPAASWRGIGISPDGRRLAAASIKQVQVFDLRTGSKITTLPTIHAFMNRVIWPDEDHLLIDGVLYSLKLQLPICSYAEHKDLMIGHGGYFPLVHHDSTAKASSLCFLKLPEQSAIQQASTMKKSDGFAVYPGCKVRLVIQLVEGAESAKLRESIIWELKKTLQKNNWQIVDDAPTTILVRVEGFTMTRTFTLKRSTVGGVVDALKGIFGSDDEQDKEQVTIDCKGFKQTLQLKHGETTLLERQHYVGAPDKFDVGLNESIKDAAERAAKPDPTWFSTVELEDSIRIPIQNKSIPTIKLSDQK